MDRTPIQVLARSTVTVWATTISRTNSAFDRRRPMWRQEVADVMAERVVDVLEAVEDVRSTRVNPFNTRQYARAAGAPQPRPRSHGREFGTGELSRFESMACDRRHTRGKRRPLTNADCDFLYRSSASNDRRSLASRAPKAIPTACAARGVSIRPASRPFRRPRR